MWCTRARLDALCSSLPLNSRQQNAQLLWRQFSRGAVDPADRAQALAQAHAVATAFVALHGDEDGP